MGKFEDNMEFEYIWRRFERILMKISVNLAEPFQADRRNTHENRKTANGNAALLNRSEKKFSKGRKGRSQAIHTEILCNRKTSEGLFRFVFEGEIRNRFQNLAYFS